MTWNLRRKEVLDGDQLRAMLEESPASAARAILSAAQANIVDAQALLGQILLDSSGIERDPALALVWFQIVARHGHAMAQNMARRCHEHGWRLRSITGWQPRPGLIGVSTTTPTCLPPGAA